MLYQNPLLISFLNRAENFPDQNIIVETSGRTITSKKLAEDAKNLAINLSKKGFRKRDKALILVRPGIDAITCILAVMWLGGVVVFADPGMGKDVFEGRVRLAKPKWVFIETLLLLIQKAPPLISYLRKTGYDIPEFSNLGAAKIVLLGSTILRLNNGIPYKSLLRKPLGGNILLDRVKDSDEAVIVFTSGTTDLPKGVIHSVGSLKDTLDKIEALSSPTSKDIFYGALPHFLLLSISIGVTAIVSKKKFTAGNFMRDIHKYKPTIIFGPPAEFIEITKYCKINNKKIPPFVRKIFLGSAPVLTGFLVKFIKVLNINTQIKCIYGMTEILPVAVVDGRIKALWPKEGDLLGDILSGVKYKISSEGELILSGRNLFKGYLNFPPQKIIRSGDLVKLDGGNLVLIGRKKDMIIRGNFNIYPGLYEPTIQKIPEVAACAIIGVRDEEIEDERIILVIEPEDFTNKNVKNTVEESIKSGKFSIDTHALPDEIVIMKIPRSGRQSKIDKRRLRELLKIV